MLVWQSLPRLACLFSVAEGANVIDPHKSVQLQEIPVKEPCTTNGHIVPTFVHRNDHKIPIKARSLQLRNPQQILAFTEHLDSCVETESTPSCNNTIMFDPTYLLEHLIGMDLMKACL